MSEAQTAAPTVETATTETPDEVQAPISTKEKIKLQVYGQEIEEEVDWNDRTALTAKLQKAAASDKIAQSAKQHINEAKTEKEKAMRVLQAYNDGSLFKGHPNARAMAEQFLMESINEEMLDPKDKKIRDLENENKGFKTAKEKETEAANQKVNAEKEYKIAQDFQTTIIGALNKSGLPKTPKLVQRAAELMSKNLDYGLTLTVEDLVSELRNETSSLTESILKDMSDEDFVKFVGPERLKSLRKHDLKTLMDSQGKVFQKGSKPPVQQPQASPEKGYMTPEEYKAMIDERVKAHS